MARYRVIGKPLPFEGRTYPTNSIITTDRDLLKDHPHRVWLVDDTGNRVKRPDSQPEPAEPPKEAQESTVGDETAGETAETNAPADKE